MSEDETADVIRAFNRSHWNAIIGHMNDGVPIIIRLHVDIMHSPVHAGMRCVQCGHCHADALNIESLPDFTLVEYADKPARIRIVII